MRKLARKPTRGVQPHFVDNGDVFVIDSKAVRPLGVEQEWCGRTTRAFYEGVETGRARVMKGDVLLNSTGRGTLGRAGVYDLSSLAIADNHVSILSIVRGQCDPDYLALYLNSPPGQWHAEQYQTGSSGQLELYPFHIWDFLVFRPLDHRNTPDLKWQERLGDKVRNARRTKLEAERLSAAAIRLVENAVREKLS